MFLSEINAVFVGAGKISYSLAHALIKAECNIVSVISKNIKSAKAFSAKFKVKHYSDNIRDIASAANFFILSVPDNQIEQVSVQIAALDLNFKKNVFIHLSGVETSNVLNAIKSRGGNTASYHIMQTFPSKRIVDLIGCYAAVETDDRTIKKLLFDLTKKMKLIPFYLSPESKIFYHLSGVYASNFLTGNFFIAESLFNIASQDRNFPHVVNPIIETTLKNILKDSAINSLSGPLERADKKTILKHLSAFDDLIKTSRNKPEVKLLKQNYIIQSLNLLGLVNKREGKLSKDYLEIKKILTAGLK